MRGKRGFVSLYFLVSATAMGVLTSTGKELQLGCQRAESLPALALSAAGTAST